MSSYSNQQWLTQLSTYVSQLAAGTISPTAFVASMQSYTDGWIGIAASDAVLAQQVTNLVSDVVQRDANFDAWVNGSAVGGPNGDGNYPLTTLAGGVFTAPCIAKMLTLVAHGADAKTGLSFDCLGPWNPGELLRVMSPGGSLVLDTAGIVGGSLIAPTGAPVVTFKKNGLAWGTVTFGIGATGFGVVTAQSFTSNAVLPNDLIAMYAPAAGDATFADFTITLPGVSS